MKLAIRFLWAAVFFLMQGCGLTMPPIQGAVTDLVTGQPIADVDVVVLYIGGGKGADGHYYDRCSANRITKTDANGHYQVDGFYLRGASKKTRYAILLYKDGYRAGTPGRYEKTIIDKRMTLDKDVYEYDEGYEQKRDYTGVINGWGSIERYQKTILTPYDYLGSNILGSDNDHQTLFYGCAEKGRDDPGLNAFAQKFILKWIDAMPTENRFGYRNACYTTKGYVTDHPEFVLSLFSTPQRTENLKALCPDVWSSIKAMDVKAP